MTFISTAFILFIFLVTFFYYIVPARKRWIVLLAASYIFYGATSFKAFLYLIPTTFLVFISARQLGILNNELNKKTENITDREEKKRIKEKYKNAKKTILAFSLTITIGILCILKYTNFIVQNFVALIEYISRSRFAWNQRFSPIQFFIPLGLSFYTFSAAGYLIDIYYNKYPAEDNFFKLSLFMTFFPSIVQGPINRNNNLRYEFFEKEHKFSLQVIQFGTIRILWGLLKKLIIADRADQVVTYIFNDYSKLPWFIILFGLFMYAIELYADFAGGMDIALGVAELFGIKLPENFKQPYFAKTVADFWRRWHITLGTWMKDYIFFPLSLSKQMMNLSKRLLNNNKFLARAIPACIGNIIVFLLVGIWHGAYWHYIFWGLYQGIIISSSILLENQYSKLKQFLRINEKSNLWLFFCVIRTFVIILVGYILDEISNLKQIKGMFLQLFNFTNSNLISNFKYTTFSNLTIITVLFFSAIWLIISLLKEKDYSVRLEISKLKLPVRWIIYLTLILSIPFFQASDSVGFMYANF